MIGGILPAEEALDSIFAGLILGFDIGHDHRNGPVCIFFGEEYFDLADGLGTWIIEQILFAVRRAKPAYRAVGTHHFPAFLAGQEFRYLQVFMFGEAASIDDKAPWPEQEK